jgi:hypothetical protein
MRKISLPMLIFLAVLLLGSNSGPAKDSRGPKLVVAEPLFDAGEVMEGEIVKHAFRVMNAGDKVLRIKNVKPG